MERFERRLDRGNLSTDLEYRAQTLPVQGQPVSETYAQINNSTGP